MPRILLTQAIHPQAQLRLAELGDLVIAADTRADTLRAAAQGCEVIVVRAPLPEDIFTAAPSLLGAVRHGAGVDMIPLDAASANGVLVANVPGVNAQSVAEHVLLKLLQLARRGAAMEAALRGGAGWLTARAIADGSVELAGRTVGIVGLGNVGQAIARACSQGLAMRVLGFRRRGAGGDLPSFIDVRPTLDDLLAQSAFVVLACPLDAQTRGLIGARELALLPRGAGLVNVARGPVVETEALQHALHSGHLAGAALDVFDTQPLPAAHPLWAMPEVLITPHVAGITDDSMRRMGEGATRAVASLLRGELPPHCLNPHVLQRFGERCRDARRRAESGLGG